MTHFQTQTIITTLARIRTFLNINEAPYNSRLARLRNFFESIFTLPVRDSSRVDLSVKFKRHDNRKRAAATRRRRLSLACVCLCVTVSLLLLRHSSDESFQDASDESFQDASDESLQDTSASLLHCLSSAHTHHNDKQTYCCVNTKDGVSKTPRLN